MSETPIEKIVAIYNCVSELAKLSTKVETNLKDYEYYLYLKNIPVDSKYVTLNLSTESDGYLLRVKKPSFERCPTLPEELKEWISDDWSDYRKEVNYKEQLEDRGSFDDSEERVKAYDSWLEKRNQWVKCENENRIVDGIFSMLYKIHNDFKNDSESKELLIANGIIKDKLNLKVNHPILTKRIKTEFEPEENIITLEDTDSNTKLYTSIFPNIERINNNSIASLEEELNENEYYPIGKETQNFLKRFAHELSSDSSFITEFDDKSANKSRITIRDNPVIILRKRVSGVVNCIDNILKNIEETNYVPEALLKLVNGSEEMISDEYVEPSISEQLAAVCGEDIDIFLSKEANKEQLEIAKKIEKSSAVVVQGPPGTGKTHTIANLLGHFLAQGKSVLVTSHTKKALAVLKDKVSPDIKDLCVSMLEDSNADMQTSIENIEEKRANYTASYLKKSIDEQSRERGKIIDELAENRKKIYDLRYCEHNSIAIDGESVSPSQMAAFITENREKLSYIPGKVPLDTPCPLSMEEITFLYETNKILSESEESLLKDTLPDKSKFLNPDVFENTVKSVAVNKEKIDSICKGKNWNFYEKDSNWHFGEKEQVVRNLNSEKIEELSNLRSKTSFNKKWQKFAVISGLKEDSSLTNWKTLIDSINLLVEISDRYETLSFGKKIKIDSCASNYISTYEGMKKELAESGKLSKFKITLNRNYKEAMSMATIDGHQISGEEDCQIIIDHLNILSLRGKCASYWNGLLKRYDLDDFYNLDKKAPEKSAAKYIPEFYRYLNWSKVEMKTIVDSMAALGVDYKEVFHISELDSEEEIIDVFANDFTENIKKLSELLKAAISINESNKIISSSLELIADYKESELTCSFIDALTGKDVDNYKKVYSLLETLLDKQDIFYRRKELLVKLGKHAPEWSKAIEARQGIHGKKDVPEDICGAWKLNKYTQYLEDLLDVPFSELQKKSVLLSGKYRDVTSRVATLMAWFHLIRRLDENTELVQSLQSWKQITARIGKGTGKRAAEHKKQARDLMGKCQKAVPCWIMTINKAVETLDPAENHFDIVIVDEASQADISSLAVAYMAEKIIVVGDDKQVSPMAIGENTDKVNSIAERTIKGLTPYWSLFDSKFSLYALASTSYKALMLKEHFRCVPEIIGFCNKLSYDFKIKPLRDSGNSGIYPTVVPFRVNGKRNDNKTNNIEADYIVALIKACIEQPEYEDKSFGVISLLGDEQASLIYQRLIEHISPTEMEKRNILCGNAANFQGDERDVVFLSMVDSSREGGPLRKTTYGVDDSTKKRYNVAVSRAKDQLWIVHSLDPANDLKTGDIRKELLDYASDPEGFLQQIEEIKEKADSPFEIAVAERLVSKGYKISQQWKVGAYSIDIVVIYNNKKIAIECDGERWHSGNDKVREDMERQTILERLGWRFIRIRGSEFYSDKEKTMQRVYEELHLNGIETDMSTSEEQHEESEVLNRIKSKAADFMAGFEDHVETDMDTISYALNSSVAKDSESENPVEKNTTSKKKQESIERIKLTEWMPEFNPVVEEKPHLTIKSVTQKSSSNLHKDEESNRKRKSSAKSKKNVRKSAKNNTKGKATQKNIENSLEVRILGDLKVRNWEFIDNAETSDIIWLICNPEIKEEQESFLNDLPCSYSYEKRGTISTNNRKAWRIMIKKEK